jgi:SAM-dependent methyltransferase
MARPKIAVLLLYGCTIFLSSFLLFLIQPIFAKLILPWFGGSAAVWTTCLVFFEVALLAGYSYAHLIRRLRGQVWIHTAVIASALAFLPVIPGRHWKPELGSGAPAWRILALLTVVLGLPFFVLSTTGPLLQHWFARRWPGAEPYRLFALSNAASMLALIAYPVLIEPRSATRAQDLAWSGAFVVFAALCFFAAWNRRGAPDTRDERSAPVSPPSTAQRLTWIALAAGGSMLLLSTTNQLTQNVAAVPLLWILPLAIYLATFILCFESSRWYRRNLFLRLLAVALGSLSYAIYDIDFSDAILVAIPIFAAGLFIGCMFCHGELSLRKPDHSHLTSFYLDIAQGGALGGLLVGLIAPLMFSGVYELPCSLLFVAAMALWLNWESGWAARLLWGVVTAAMVAVVVVQIGAYHRDAIRVTRNFYGSLRVVDHDGLRTLFHGTIKHGTQFQSPERRKLPTTYYGFPSGAGLTLDHCCSGPKRAGIIGLGAGTLAAYGRSGDEFHFYEINPQVIDIAQSQFSYLRDSAAKIEITLGDARLALESEAPQNFDVLMVDAFSGDAIPVHLLTREAFALYLRHLNPDGVLAVHVSNQYLDLAPVVGQLAAEVHQRAVLIRSPKDESEGLSEALWVLATRDRDFLSQPTMAQASESIAARPGLRLWTDGYNNLLEVLRF